MPFAMRPRIRLAFWTAWGLMAGGFATPVRAEDAAGVPADALPPREQPAPTPQTSGPELAFRTGYTAGAGTIDETPLVDSVRAIVPLSFDFGYRLNEQWLVGGYAQYGFGIRGATANARCPDCVSSLARYGLQVQYHLPNPRSLWMGLGIGRQTLNTNLDEERERSRTNEGWELLQLQLGGDFPVANGLAVGPFAATSLGTLGSRVDRCENETLCPRAEQEVTRDTRSWPIVWVTVGVRVVLLP